MTDFCRNRYGGHHEQTLSPYREYTVRNPLFNQNIRSPDQTDDRNQYRFESVRRNSFANWPVNFMDIIKLAEAGFYYTKESDKVRCFECRVEICKWVEGDDPMFEHQRWSERCRFVRKIPCGNVPFGTDPSEIPPPLPRARDVCGPYGIDVRPENPIECCSASQNFQHLSTAQLGSWGIGVPKEPQHPQYSSHDARLRTFELWPKSMKQTKEELADAGFFYTGKGDQTLCYHCGGGLKDWEPLDNPWEQHAQWFSKCYYLLTVKGQAFVDQVKGQSRPPPSIEDTKNLNLPNYIRKVEQQQPPHDHHHNEAMETSTEEDEEVEEEICHDVENRSEPGTSNLKKKGSMEETNGSSSGRSGLKNRRKSIDSAYGSQESNEDNNKKCHDDGRLCKICYTEELGVVFLPCGHMVACVKCAPSLTTCAVCREPFKMTVRAFIS